MKSQKTYAVFGLGRYGYSVARELVSNGAEVLAIDDNEAIVNSAAASIPICKCADVTDPEVIKALGISEIDVVIVCMAQSLEASVMAVMHCKECGVKTVIAKCGNETHRKILEKVGADKVVFPETESGTRLAKNLVSSGFIDVIELSDDISIVELDVKPEWVGKTLIELNLRKKYSLNVVAIKCADVLTTDIDPNMPLADRAKLVVIINSKALEKLS